MDAVEPFQATHRDPRQYGRACGVFVPTEKGPEPHFIEHQAAFYICPERLPNGGILSAPSAKAHCSFNNSQLEINMENSTLPLPPYDGPEAPNAQRPTNVFLPWATVAFFLYWISGATRCVYIPLLYSTAIFAFLIALNAAVLFPHGDGGAAARRRLPLLALLALPPLAAFILRVLEINPGTGLTRGDRNPVIDYGLPGIAAFLPFVLVPAMRGATYFTLNMGILAALLTLILMGGIIF